MAQVPGNLESWQGSAGVSEQYTPAQVAIAVCMRLGLPFDDQAFGNPGFDGQMPVRIYDIPGKDYQAIHVVDARARMHDVIVARQLRILPLDEFGGIFRTTFSAIELTPAAPSELDSLISSAES